MWNNITLLALIATTLVGVVSGHFHSHLHSHLSSIPIGKEVVYEETSIGHGGFGGLGIHGHKSHGGLHRHSLLLGGLRKVYEHLSDFEFLRLLRRLRRLRRRGFLLGERGGHGDVNLSLNLGFNRFGSDFQQTALNGFGSSGAGYSKAALAGLGGLGAGLGLGSALSSTSSDF